MFSNDSTGIGGRFISERMVVPKQGYIIICRDTEGTGFRLWEVDKEAKSFSIIISISIFVNAPSFGL
jgi:hypothetical protein